MAKRETKAGGEAQPKRKVGRPKGTPKSPGSGRVKRTSIQIARDKARDSIWSYVVKGLSGQAVKSRGPTGKAISQPLTEDNQIRLLQTAWRKLEPDHPISHLSVPRRSPAVGDPKGEAQFVVVRAQARRHSSLGDSGAKRSDQMGSVRVKRPCDETGEKGSGHRI